MNSSLFTLLLYSRSSHVLDLGKSGKQINTLSNTNWAKIFRKHIVILWIIFQWNTKSIMCYDAGETYLSANFISNFI